MVGQVPALQSFVVTHVSTGSLQVQTVLLVSIHWLQLVVAEQLALEQAGLDELHVHESVTIDPALLDETGPADPVVQLPELLVSQDGWLALGHNTLPVQFSVGQAASDGVQVHDCAVPTVVTLLAAPVEQVPALDPHTAGVTQPAHVRSFAGCDTQSASGQVPEPAVQLTLCVCNDPGMQGFGVQLPVE